MATHWVDAAFEEWGATSAYSEGGLRHLDTMRLESLTAQVREVLDFVNACPVSSDDWERYRGHVAEVSREWPEPLLEWSETPEAGVPRVRLRPEPPSLPVGRTRNRLQVLVFNALTNGWCGEHDLGDRELRDE